MPQSSGEGDNATLRAARRRTIYDMLQEDSSLWQHLKRKQGRELKFMFRSFYGVGKLADVAVDPLAIEEVNCGPGD